MKFLKQWFKDADWNGILVFLFLGFMCAVGGGAVFALVMQNHLPIIWVLIAAIMAVVATVIFAMYDRKGGKR